MFPASNVSHSPGLTFQEQVYFWRRGLDKLRSKTRFRSVLNKYVLPRKSGRTIQFFRTRDGSANTTATVEGSPGGSGVNLAANVLPVTLTQYSGFGTISDVLEATSFYDMMNELVDHLSYIAALSVDSIARAIFDNSAASASLTAGGTYLRAPDLDAARVTLQNLEVEPYSNGFFKVYMSPMITYDIKNDPAAAGYLDRYKYTMPEDQGLLKAEDRGIFGRINNCEIIELNRVYTAGSPTQYRTYVFGKGCGASVDLEGMAPSDVVDANVQTFKVNTVKAPASGISLYDLEGLVAGGASYKFMWAAALTSGPTGIGGAYRWRKWDTVSSLG